MTTPHEAPKPAASTSLDDLLAAPALPSENKGKAKLNRENQVLTAQNQKLQGLVKILAASTALMIFVALGLVLYMRGAQKRAFREAFQVLHYREKRTLQANAIVLAEYADSLRQLQQDVKGFPGISEEERAIRNRAMAATVEQADKLRDGFIKMVKDNDRERGKGATFEYRDPFLKRPINFDSELGGEISLDKLREEVKTAAKMDEATKELRAVMLNPTPIADQMKVEAKRQDAPVVDEAGRDIPRLPQGAGALQAPGQAPALRLPGLPTQKVVQ